MVSIMNPQLRERLLHVFQNPDPAVRLPSPSTLYHQPLTVHAGWCLLQRELTEEILGKENITKWLTVD